ncbi:AAA family ATPase [Actinoplanes sp. TRM 88003]|uniref:AAA family ATPase n=1 Tax=Paractinoplanes aksuensis TaxID=2939490 RepID=A0ABT1DXB5_9ACTN|nr:LuxR family transcriptional regulator [Actinoplanes aksuensis]MCO8275504.1 AAA family ATPase [Actinoplanes aksuensis]
MGTTDRDTSPGNLVGRGREQAELGGVLGSLRSGGRCLVMRGEPGVGKSALLRWTTGRAAQRGTAVLSITAVEDEFDLPYAGLHLLAAQLRRGESPPEVAHLLRTLAAEAPPALVAGALLDLIAALTGGGPLLIAVDDAQWLDPASWSALVLAGHRVADDPVLVLLSMRDGTRTTARLALAELPEYVLGPLPAADAAELLDRRAPDLRADLREVVLAEAAGNPLGVIELAAGVRKVGVGAAGQLPLTERLERAFGRAVEELPAGTRAFIEVAAVNDSSDGQEIRQAARLLYPLLRDEDARLAVTEKAVELEDGQVVFRHPLVRSAVRQRAGALRRRQVHAALGEVIDPQDRRQLWHRAEAASGPDDQLAAELARAGQDARRRGALTSARQAFERVARLSADPRTQVQALMTAICIASDEGEPAAINRMVEVLSERPLPPAEQTIVANIRVALDGQAWVGDDHLAHLVDVLDSFAQLGETEFALEFLADFSLRLLFANPGPELAGRVVGLADRLERPEYEGEITGIRASVAPVEQCAAVLPVLRRFLANPVLLASQATDRLPQAAMAVGALPEAHELNARILEISRRRGRVGNVAMSLVHRASTAAQLGEAFTALTLATEARGLNRELGQSRWALTAELMLGRALALRGEAEQAGRIADAVEQVLLPIGAYPMLANVQLVRGTAAMAAGKPELAYDELASILDPGAVPYHATLRFWAVPYLAEAALLGGRVDALHDLIVDLGVFAERGIPVLRVGLNYARAVRAETDEGYTSALAFGDLSRWPFEQARLRFAYGVWLRRQRRVGDARTQLRAAAGVFTAFGAVPWAQRADAELRATGERVERQPDVRQALTPQEWQIAELVTDGLTSKEIANRLFLSVRTVDSHLSRAYRKVGVSSRAELTKVLLDGR